MALKETQPKIWEWFDRAYKIGVIVIPLTVVLWMLTLPLLKKSLGVSEIEERTSQAAGRVDFLAVVTICNSGKYSVDEIRNIKARFQRRILDVDSLIADWYERP